MKLKCRQPLPGLPRAKSVLMIAHRLSTVANADCIYVVQDGQIVESGTKDELCAQNGLFARIVAGLSGLGAVEGRKGGVRNDRKKFNTPQPVPRRAQRGL